MGLQLKGLVEPREIELKELAGKTIAIDTYNILYQFLASIRGPDGASLTDSSGNVTSHLVGLFSRTTKLLQYDTKLIFVFDGKPPELKKAERERRRKLKEAAQVEYEVAKEREDVAAMKKFASRTMRLTPAMVQEAKMLVQALGCPIVEAPSEGEAQVAALVQHGYADYGSSQDYDALLYGIPRLVRNLSIAGKRKKAGAHHYTTVKPEVIEATSVFNSLGIDKEQLIVLAILMGTDYNKQGIKGIGPKKALKLVKEHKKDFDTIFSVAKWDEHYDFSWRVIYDAILHMPVLTTCDLDFGKYDEKKVRALLCDEHDFSPERVKNTLAKLAPLHEQKKQKGLGDFF